MSFLRWLSIDLKLLLFCERSLEEAKIEQFTCVSLETTIGTIGPRLLIETITSKDLTDIVIVSLYLCSSKTLS